MGVKQGLHSLLPYQEPASFNDFLEGAYRASLEVCTSPGRSPGHCLCCKTQGAVDSNLQPTVFFSLSIAGMDAEA